MSRLGSRYPITNSETQDLLVRGDLTVQGQTTQVDDIVTTDVIVDDANGNEQFHIDGDAGTPKFDAHGNDIRNVNALEFDTGNFNLVDIGTPVNDENFEIQIDHNSKQEIRWIRATDTGGSYDTAMVVADPNDALFRVKDSGDTQVPNGALSFGDGDTSISSNWDDAAGAFNIEMGTSNFAVPFRMNHDNEGDITWERTASTQDAFNVVNKDTSNLLLSVSDGGSVSIDNGQLTLTGVESDGDKHLEMETSDGESFSFEELTVGAAADLAFTGPSGEFMRFLNSTNQTRIQGDLDLNGSELALDNNAEVVARNNASDGDIILTKATTNDDVLIGDNAATIEAQTDLKLDNNDIGFNNADLNFGSGGQAVLSLNSGSNFVVRDVTNGNDTALAVNSGGPTTIRDVVNDVDIAEFRNEDSTVFYQGIDAGTIEAPEDSYSQLVDTDVTSSPSAGAQVGYTFAVDSTKYFELYAEADGSGGVQNAGIRPVNNLHNTSSDISTDGEAYLSVDSSGGARTVTISTSDTKHGKEINIKRNGANNVSVETEGSETIDDSTSYTLSSDNESVTLVYNSVNSDWEVY